jgi:hypothetical protein
MISELKSGCLRYLSANATTSGQPAGFRLPRWSATKYSSVEQHAANAGKYAAVFFFPSAEFTDVRQIRMSFSNPTKRPMMNCGAKSAIDWPAPRWFDFGCWSDIALVAFLDA